MLVLNKLILLIVMCCICMCEIIDVCGVDVVIAAGKVDVSFDVDGACVADACCEPIVCMPDATADDAGGADDVVADGR